MVISYRTTGNKFGPEEKKLGPSVHKEVGGSCELIPLPEVPGRSCLVPYTLAQQRRTVALIKRKKIALRTQFHFSVLVKQGPVFTHHTSSDLSNAPSNPSHFPILVL